MSQTSYGFRAHTNPCTQEKNENLTKREYKKWLDSIKLTQNFRTDI